MSSKEYKQVYGLDLSLTEPGWAKYDVLNKELTFGIIDVKKTKGFERIDLIRERLDDVMDYKFADEPGTKLVIIEGYSFMSKGNSAISLGELGGVIRHAFYTFEIPYRECAPTQLKKFVCGAGTAGKELILRDIYKNFNIEVDNNNAADAVGLCYIGLTALGLSDKKVTKDQQAIADKVLNGENK